MKRALGADIVSRPDWRRLGRLRIRRRHVNSNTAVLLSRGDLALRDGQIFGAIEAFSGAIALRPESMLAHLRRGETYRQRGDLDAAARDFRKAVALDPSATRPLEALGDVLYRRQRFKGAADVLPRAASASTTGPSTCVQARARALPRWRHRCRARGARASSPASTIDCRIPTTCSVSACVTSGAFQRRSKRLKPPSRGRRRWFQLERSSPSSTAPWDAPPTNWSSCNTSPSSIEPMPSARSRWGWRKPGPDTASWLSSRSAMPWREPPDQAPIYAALGRCWLEMAPVRSDALSKALEALERVASTAAGTSDVMTLYGRALLEANQPEAAERVLQQATDRYPVDPQAFLAYADVAERQDHPAARQGGADRLRLARGDRRDVHRASDENRPALAATGRPGGGQCLVSTRAGRGAPLISGIPGLRLSMRLIDAAGVTQLS